MRHVTTAILMISASVSWGDVAMSPAFAERADDQPPPGAILRAVEVARTAAIPKCTVFVDAGASARGDGTAQKPHKTIAAAVAAADNGAVICVAEGTYAEALKPGEKYFTLAGGFQSGKDFKVRDSARYVSRAKGNGGSFIRIEDPGPKGDQLVAIDGFDISGYSQAIYRHVYYSQRFDITNNFIHDNRCTDPSMIGAGFSLSNVSGKIHGNVFRNNLCGRGGAGALIDSTNENTVSIERNHIDASAGTEPGSSHGGGLYLLTKTIKVSGNLFTGNTVTAWGAGLYIGSDTAQHSTATLSWNIYRNNRAGISGGGLFCDDGATCISEHEIFDANCGGNILLDGGNAGPTIARFNHMTNVGAREVGCQAPGNGVQVDKGTTAPDAYSFTNAIFWGNAPGRDFALTCDQGCGALKVNVTYSMVQTDHVQNGAKVTFGAGIVAPADPLFANPGTGDFHLKSSAGRWTPSGYVKDNATSPALGKSSAVEARDRTAARTDRRTELGAYGNSAEASHVP